MPAWNQGWQTPQRLDQYRRGWGQAVPAPAGPAPGGMAGMGGMGGMVGGMGPFGFGQATPAGQAAQVPSGVASRALGGLFGNSGSAQDPNAPSVMHTGPAVGLDLLRWGTSGQNPYGDAWAGSIYNPMGYQPYLDAIRQQGLSDAGGRMNALRLQNQVSGGDPYLNAYAALMGQMRGQSDTSRLLGQAQLGQMEGAQDFYRQLLFQLMGGAYQMQGVDRQREMAKMQKDAGTMGAIGGLVGGGLGAMGGI